MILRVGLEAFSLSHGLRVLLGWMWADELSSDARLEAIANEMGLLAPPGEEDQLLEKVSDGLFSTARKPVPSSEDGKTFFLALAPLGHIALRLYVSRYFLTRPTRTYEYLSRVKMALRQEEIDLAAVGFMRDEATAEELSLMKAARDRKDSYAFAFECLLGHLALTKPYRLHQIIANFGWALPLPPEFYE